MKHARNDAASPVIDQHLAGNRTDPRIAERSNDGQQRAAFDHAVAVDGDKDIAPRAADGQRHGLALAPIAVLPERGHQTGIALSGRRYIVPGVVLAAVVDGDDLDLVARIVSLDDRGDGVHHHRTFIVGRNDDSDGRRLFAGDGRYRAVDRPKQRASAEQQQPGRRPEQARIRDQPPVAVLIQERQDVRQYAAQLPIDSDDESKEYQRIDEICPCA